MLTKPQFGASQDKNYLLALAPTIAIAIFSFQSTTHAMGSYANAQTLNAWSTPSTAIVSETPKSAADKNIDAGNDKDNQDNVREAIPLWETKSLNHKAWSEHIYRELPVLGPELLTANPVDAKIFCPNFPNLSESERKQFWAFFISSMAKFESGFDPNESYTEGFKDNTNTYVISRGLLQISLESSKGYRCGFSTGRELYHPTKNLSCGIKILNHWMKKDNRIASRFGLNWKGGARYWAVLRQSRKQSYTSIVKWSNDLPFCKL